MKILKNKIYDEVKNTLEQEYHLDYKLREQKRLAEFRSKDSIVKLAIDVALKSSKPSLAKKSDDFLHQKGNNDFKKVCPECGNLTLSKISENVVSCENPKCTYIGKPIPKS